MKLSTTPGSVSGRRVDRLGDPLDGLINLFDLALVLAVGLLLAALSSAGVVGLVSGPAGAGTPLPGEPGGSNQTQGQGQEVGKVFRLQDGTYVFSPTGAPLTNGATGATGAPPASTTPQPGSTGATQPPSPSTGGGVGIQPTPPQVAPTNPSGGF